MRTLRRAHKTSCATTCRWRRRFLTQRQLNDNAALTTKRPDDIVESETKKARLDRDETAKDLVAKVIAVDSVLCVQPSNDLTNDAMALSSKVPVVEAAKGKARELDNLLTFHAMKSVSCHVDTKRMTRFGWDAWRGDRVRSRLCVRHFKAEQQRDAMVAGTPETFLMICLISRAASETCWGDFETGHERSVHARSDK